MHTTLRTTVGFGLIAVVATLGVAGPAWSDDDHRKDHRGHRRDAHERRDERRDDRRDAREWQRRREAELRELQLRRAAERHEWERRERHRDWERHRDLERHRAAALWRFERNRGWRWEHRPGVWSPFFVWWAVDGRPLLRPYPAVRIVRYQTGYYELAGDGINVPFYWVWRPTVVVATPPPLPAPPPFPTDYSFPSGGAYPPPPPGFPTS